MLGLLHSRTHCYCAKSKLLVRYRRRKRLLVVKHDYGKLARY